MNTFKRKSLFAALAGLSALGVTGAAQAVHVNPDGLGQVLLYPYYTVRTNGGNAYNTLLSVVNSTASVKAVKVRFLEGKNSREVLDFNLYLSPYDVWTGGIVATTNAAKIMTEDKSCTVPPIPAAGQEFVNYAYTGTSADGATGSLDRTREGYFEIIEMGEVADIGPGQNYATYATHVGGEPYDCDTINDDDYTGDIEDAISPPTGGLFGHESLVNVNLGTDYTADPTVLDAFSSDVLWYTAGSIYPNLTQAFPQVSVLFDGAYSWRTSWPAPAPWPSNGADPVSAVLMHNAVMNEYVLDPGAKAGTDWVVTFPTKNFYYTAQIVSGTTGAVVGMKVHKLFQRNFSANGACDDIDLLLFDREERREIIRGFSPPPPSGGLVLCWESSVLTYNNSNVLGSTNSSNINTPASGTPNGWVRIGFNAVPTTHYFAGTPGTAHVLAGSATIRTATTGGTTSYTTATYYGLPTIGFAVHSYRYDALSTPSGTVQSNFGGNPVHKNSRFVVPGAIP